MSGSVIFVVNGKGGSMKNSYIEYWWPSSNSLPHYTWILLLLTSTQPKTMACGTGHKCGHGHGCGTASCGTSKPTNTSSTHLKITILLFSSLCSGLQGNPAPIDEPSVLDTLHDSQWHVEIDGNSCWGFAKCECLVSDTLLEILWVVAPQRWWAHFMWHNGVGEAMLKDFVMWRKVVQATAKSRFSQFW